MDFEGSVLEVKQVQNGLVATVFLGGRGLVDLEKVKDDFRDEASKQNSETVFYNTSLLRVHPGYCVLCSQVLDKEFVREEAKETEGL